MAAGGAPQALRALLAEDAVFHSPVVHTPQERRDKVFAYLHAASHVLGGDSLRYLREIVDGDQVCLEFVCQLDGIQINRVDIIRCDANGQRSEEDTYQPQSLMRTTYTDLCCKTHTSPLTT